MAELFVARADLPVGLSAAARGDGAEARESRPASYGSGSTPTSKTIPNEVGLLGVAVHLDKGCYPRPRRPWRACTRWGGRRAGSSASSSTAAPTTCRRPVRRGARWPRVGFVGPYARHLELGPIALAMIKRNVPVDATLIVDGVAASQDPLVNPEIGLHVRPQM